MSESFGNTGAEVSPDPWDRAIGRRGFLKVAGAGAAALGAGGLLAACGGASTTSSSTSSTTAASQPKRGGTLRGGFTGGTSADTLNPLTALNNVDFSRINNLFEGLVEYDDNAQPRYVLAEELTANADATEWTIRLRPGITFHNGKDLTADDVIYTIQQIVNPKSPGSGAPPLATVDVAGMRKLDAHTLRVPCKTPFASFLEVMAGPEYFQIVPVGFDPHHPVGTGAFKLESFTAGVQSTLARYDGYWQSGLPYLDGIVSSDYADETSQVNALLGGQVDVINLLSAEVISTVQSGGANVLTANGGGWTPFTMRVDVAPFNDVRVRQAMRLIVNRKEMMDLVFGGHGTLGNDMFGIWDPMYDHTIPQREQDLAQARHLLKQAGQEGLSVTLATSDIAQGTLRAAQVFAQQANGAGVNVKLQTVTVTDFYGTNYLKWPFAQDYWYYDPYLPQVALATLPTAPYNECHFDNKRYNSLYAEGLRQVDKTRQAEIVHEMQRIDYEEGGYIIPYFPPVIDGYSAKVHGLVPSKVGISLGNLDFKRVWLD